MPARRLSFSIGERTIHTAVLRQHPKFRWNAFLWGAGLSFAHTFARRSAAERWLTSLLKQRFPTLPLNSAGGIPQPTASQQHAPRLHRDASYRA